MTEAGYEKLPFYCTANHYFDERERLAEREFKLLNKRREYLSASIKKLQCVAEIYTFNRSSTFG
jgi:hypothetical protein